MFSEELREIAQNVISSVEDEDKKRQVEELDEWVKKLPGIIKCIKELTIIAAKDGKFFYNVSASVFKTPDHYVPLIEKRIKLEMEQLGIKIEYLSVLCQYKLSWYKDKVLDEIFISGHKGEY